MNRETYLADQEKLFDLVVEQQGGALSKSLEDAVYKLYTTEHLDTEAVASRIDTWVKNDTYTGTAPATIAVTADQRIEEALYRAFYLAGQDGSHHKEYAIDQMVRALTGKDYRTWVAEWENGEDGPNTYEWSTGIPA